jgi:DNA replication protein DnaC
MTAHDLVDDLGRAYRQGPLDRRMRIYLAPKVLIIDEMGYLPLDALGATNGQCSLRARQHHSDQ